MASLLDNEKEASLRSRRKLKTLYVAQLLMQRTDKKHGVTMSEILEYLEEKGISAERKSLYADFAVLGEMGLEIRKIPTQPVSYGVENRLFSETEINLLIDAVQSSKFLTKGKSDALVRSIRKLGISDVSRPLGKRVHVARRVSSLNDSSYRNVDVIQEAMGAGKKVEFRYFSYNAACERVLRHSGRVYSETPVSLVYAEGSYYLIVFNDRHDDFATYRVDRMTDVRVSEDRATKNSRIATFEAERYAACVFDMYSGEPTQAVLRVQGHAMDAVIDRFGEDVPCFSLGDNTARVTVRVMESPTFFGWLARFGDSVLIEKPRALRAAYLAFLEGIAKAYGQTVFEDSRKSEVG